MNKKLNEVNDALRAIAEGNNHFTIGGVISCWADYLEECRRDMVSMIVPAVRLCNEIVAEPDRAKKDAEGILDNLRKLYDFIGGKEVDPVVTLTDPPASRSPRHKEGTMNADTLKSIIEDAHKLAKVDIAPDLVKPAVETIALRLERLVTANPPLGKDAEEKMTRPKAVRILMQLQKLEAREGYVNIVRAYEMAIDYIVKRHRDDCRNRAKRRVLRKEGK